MNKGINEEFAKNMKFENETRDSWVARPRPGGNCRERAEFEMMVRRQHFNRFFNSDFDQKQDRVKILFGTIQKTCQILEFPVATFFRSIQIFDSINSKIEIKKENLIKFAFVSFLLAGKTSESQDKNINYTDFNRYIWPISIAEFKQIERVICRTLDFRLNLVTPHSLVCILLREFFKEGYDFFGSRKDIAGKSAKFWELVMELHLLTLLNYNFYRFSSLGVAVSVIVLARSLFGLEPWTREMEEFTKCEKEKMRIPVTFLFGLYKSNYAMKLLKKIDHGERMEHGSSVKSEKSSMVPSLVGYTQEYTLSESNLQTGLRPCTEKKFKDL